MSITTNNLIRGFDDVLSTYTEVQPLTFPSVLWAGIMRFKMALKRYSLAHYGLYSARLG